MVFSNLLSVRTSLKDWANRNDLSDAQYDQFINLSQDRINRLVDTPPLEKESSLIVDSNNEIAVPSDYKEVIYFSVEAESRTHTLERESPSTIRNSQHITGIRPKTFARVGESFIFSPLPSEGEALSLYYYAELLDLSDDLDTNEVVTDMGEALLYGALAEFSIFIRDDALLTKFESKFQNATLEFQQQEDKSMWSGDAIAVNLI